MILLLACSPPQAPETIEEMVVYGFVHFDEPDHLEALSVELRDYLDAHAGEVDGWQVASLDTAALQAAEVDAPPIEAILGAAIAYDYQVDLVLLAEALTHPEQEEIFSSYIDFEALDESVDRGCFVEGRCPLYRAVHQVHSEVVFNVQMWTSYEVQLQWFEDSSGQRWLFTRYLGPEPVEFSVDWLVARQQYSFSAAYLHDGRARRVMSTWVDGEILSDDMPEAALLNLAIMTMNQTAADIDAWGAEQDAGR